MSQDRTNDDLESMASDLERQLSFDFTSSQGEEGILVEITGPDDDDEDDISADLGSPSNDPSTRTARLAFLGGDSLPTRSAPRAAVSTAIAPSVASSRFSALRVVEQEQLRRKDRMRSALAGEGQCAWKGCTAASREEATIARRALSRDPVGRRTRVT